MVSSSPTGNDVFLGGPASRFLPTPLSKSTLGFIYFHVHTFLVYIILVVSNSLVDRNLVQPTFETFFFECGCIQMDWCLQELQPYADKGQILWPQAANL